MWNVKLYINVFLFAQNIEVETKYLVMLPNRSPIFLLDWWKLLVEIPYTRQTHLCLKPLLKNLTLKKFDLCLYNTCISSTNVLANFVLDNICFYIIIVKLYICKEKKWEKGRTTLYSSEIFWKLLQTRLSWLLLIYKHIYSSSTSSVYHTHLYTWTKLGTAVQVKSYR